ncbi:MAG TPA: nitroreductase family protein [Acidimicrobiales bacterium]|nr:nitroreductase family protein [Acidimicrobiales bacterium]
MDVFDAMSTARAIRRYTDEPVPDDAVRKCLEAATWSPSGGNRQGWRFVILRSPEVRKILGETYRTAWATAKFDYGLTGEEAPDDPAPRARMGRTMQHFVDHFEDIPVLVLFCLQGRGHRPALAEGGSIYPAMQNFSLAARAQGLGTVVTTFFLAAEPQLREAIGIPDDWLLAGLLPLGWPVGRHGPLRRRPVEDVTYVDHWGEGFGQAPT